MRFQLLSHPTIPPLILGRIHESPPRRRRASSISITQLLARDQTSGQEVDTVDDALIQMTSTDIARSSYSAHAVTSEASQQTSSTSGFLGPNIFSGDSDIVVCQMQHEQSRSPPKSPSPKKPSAMPLPVNFLHPTCQLLLLVLAPIKIAAI